MIIEGVKIPNARVGLGGIRAFTLKAMARPRSGQRRAGKKEGVLGVNVPRNFCPPAEISDGIPAAPQARQSVNFIQNRFGFGSINAPKPQTRAWARVWGFWGACKQF
jgi:hypothetical protein